MIFKYKNALMAVAIVAMGCAEAGTITETVQGTIQYFGVTPSNNDGSIVISVDTISVGCYGTDGVDATLRMGQHLGTGSAAERTYTNIKATLLAAKLANRIVTIYRDGKCSITGVQIN